MIGGRMVALMMAAAVATVLLAGCGSSAGPASAANGTSDILNHSQEGGNGLPSPGGGVRGKTVYFVGVGDVQPWVKIHNHAIIDALTSAGANVTYLQDPFDVPTEIQNLNRAIAAGPDLIILVPLDYNAIVPSLTRAAQLKIPVINLSSPPGPAASLFTKSVEGDHLLLGKEAADAAVTVLKGRAQTTGNVMVITGPPSLTQVAARTHGFLEALTAALPDLKIVSTENGQYDTATAQKLAQQVFAQFNAKGGIQVVFSMSGNMAPGIVQAANQAGVPVGGKDGLVVVAADCGGGALPLLLSGHVAGTGQQAPVSEAEFTVDVITKWFAGADVPFRSFVPDQLVTKANAQQLMAENVCG